MGWSDRVSEAHAPELKHRWRGMEFSRIALFRLAALRVLHEPAESIHELHLFDRLAARFQEPWRAHEDCKALCARDRHIESIARREEGQVTRQVLPLQVAMQ